MSDIYTIEAVKKIRSNSNILISTTAQTFELKGKLVDYYNAYTDFLIAPNRSILVNIKMVSRLMGSELVLKNGRSVTISRNRLIEIKRRFTENVAKEMRH